MPDEVCLAEFFTHQHRIRGTLRLGGQRLTDVLNDLFNSSVELRHVEVFRILTPEETVATHSSALIEKSRLLFAISGVESATAAASRLYKHVDTAEWEAFITVSSFEVRGNLHIPPTSDLRNTLLRGSRQFIPLTGARAVVTLYPKIAFSGDVIIVNRAHIEAICTDRSADRSPHSA
jgi:hypothetical protein